MKLRSILTIGLLAVFLLVACAPAASQPEAPAQPASPESEAPAQPAAQPTESRPQAAQTELPVTETPAGLPQPVATSRGPNLEATDPSTVSLASGDLQLVEFFRFT
jgi:glucose/arabinose dehydrogenase